MSRFTDAVSQLAGRVVDQARKAGAPSAPGGSSTGSTRRRMDQPSARAVPAGVRIEYSPQLDGDPDPGEVVWTWVPYEDDPNQGKDRPVVIIGRHGDDLSGVALTSKDKGRGDQVPVGTGAWDPDGRPSYAKVDRLLDIAPGEVRREGAILARPRFDAVVAAVDRLHDVVR